MRIEGYGGWGWGGQVKWPLDIIMDVEACEKYREVGEGDLCLF